jgi:ElaB/YqjD/DUF883 family membrane-anchored ribosome-binding protein
MPEFNTRDRANAAADGLADGATDGATANSDLLAAGFSQLRQQVSGMLPPVADGGRPKAHSARESVVEATAGIGDRLASGFDSLADRSGQATDALGRRISENPLLFAGVAFGAGYVLVRLFARS